MEHGLRIEVFILITLLKSFSLGMIFIFFKYSHTKAMCVIDLKGERRNMIKLGCRPIHCASNLIHGYWIRVVTMGMEKCERKLQVCEKKISRIEYCCKIDISGRICRFGPSQLLGMWSVEPFTAL